MPLGVLGDIAPILGPVLGSLFGGGTSIPQPLLNRSSTENDLLNILRNLSGDFLNEARGQRDTNTKRFKEIGTFDPSNIPGLTPEESKFLAGLSGQFSGVSSAQPGRMFLGDLQNLMQILAAGSGSGASSQQIGNLDTQQRLTNQRNIGDAFGGLFDFLNSQQQTNQSSSFEQILPFLQAFNDTNNNLNGLFSFLNSFGLNNG